MERFFTSCGAILLMMHLFTHLLKVISPEGAMTTEELDIGIGLLVVSVALSGEFHRAEVGSSLGKTAFLVS